MNIHRLVRSISLAAGLLLAGPGVAQNIAHPGAAPLRNLPPLVNTDAPVELPKMTVNSSRLADYPPIPRADLSGGGLAPSEPPVSIFFPGRAYAEAVPRGFATVCIEVDEKGAAIDYLVVAYTEKYFGDALLNNAKGMKYSPLLFQGVAIPARFNFGYEFFPEVTVAMNSIDAIEHRQQVVSGGRPKYKYQPVTVDELDNRLEYVRQAVPNFPAGYVPKGGKKADWVLMTLYIDEQGQVRVPNVESASSPLLVQNALKAVRYWQFKPPTVKGKPVLVYAAFAVNFMKAGN